MMQPKKIKREKQSANVVHVNFTPDLEAWVKETAIAEDRTMRNMVVVLVKEARKQREEAQ